MGEALQYPDSIEELTALLRTLPGIGRRGAERLALSMLKWPPDKLENLGRLISSLPLSVGKCPRCGGMANQGELCAICRLPNRSDSELCVVENAAQIFAIESGGRFHGRYHVLGGRLSPLDGRGTDDLNLTPLLERAQSGEIKEIILALSPDVEGRATAIYLAERLKDSGVKITRPAQGLPAGANLAYADGATIAAAFDGRIPL